jgi:hypothetical protein
VPLRRPKIIGLPAFSDSFKFIHIATLFLPHFLFWLSGYLGGIWVSAKKPASPYLAHFQGVKWRFYAGKRARQRVRELNPCTSLERNVSFIGIATLFLARLRRAA